MIEVKESYRIVPTQDVKTGKVVLRECQAKKVAKFATDHKIHPSDLAERCRKDLIGVRFQGNIILEDKNYWQFHFEDWTKLTWLHDFGEYAISYPKECRVIFVPKEIPIYKHRINYTVAGENDLISDVVGVFEKRFSNEDDKFSDEDTDYWIGMGCG